MAFEYLKDVNWGAVILGAAAVTVIVAFSSISLPCATCTTIIGELTKQGIAPALTLAGAALTGGALGQMTSKFLSRARDATNTLLQR